MHATRRSRDAATNIDDITEPAGHVARRRRAARRRGRAGTRFAPPMRKDYTRFVELSNKGAKELGFADTGAMWRAKYDMPPDEFTEGARSLVGPGAAAVPEAARLRRA